MRWSKCHHLVKLLPAVFLEGAEAELSVESANDEWERFIQGEG